nr:Ras-related protein RABH1e [Ipomoea batatas]
MAVESPPSEHKLVILGDESVGKTSITTRFIYRKFNTTYKATIGIDFLSKTMYLEDRTVRFQVWQVSIEEGDAKAREFGVMFIETSAKDGFNIESLMAQVALRIPVVKLESTLEAERRNDQSSALQLETNFVSPTGPSESGVTGEQDQSSALQLETNFVSPTGPSESGVTGVPQSLMAHAKLCQKFKLLLDSAEAIQWGPPYHAKQMEGPAYHAKQIEVMNLRINQLKSTLDTERYNAERLMLEDLNLRIDQLKSTLEVERKNVERLMLELPNTERQTIMHLEEKEDQFLST